ncbi:unnamed protein product [Ixodes persulcatus]
MKETAPQPPPPQESSRIKQGHPKAQQGASRAGVGGHLQRGGRQRARVRGPELRIHPRLPHAAHGKAVRR